MKKLKEKLNAKLSKNGGFTLVEMLIVVAIIAILIVISVPMISSNLEKARVATDAANLRSAQSLAIAYYLTETSDPDSTATFATAGTEYAYRVDDSTHQGSIVIATSATAGDPGFKYGQAEGHVDGYVSLKIKSDGEITDAKWVPKT